MSKTTNKFSPEVRERAVRLVLETEGQHGSRRQAVISIASKIGCTAQTRNEWIKKAEVDSGRRAGPEEKVASCHAQRPGTHRAGFLGHSASDILGCRGPVRRETAGAKPRA